MQMVLRTLVLGLIISVGQMAAAGPLKAPMEDMGNIYKEMLFKTQSGAPLDAAMVAKAQEFGTKIDAATLILPDLIATLPAVDQATAEARYKDLMVQLTKRNVDLIQAFQAADRTRALDILKQMKDLMKLGHMEFKRP